MLGRFVFKTGLEITFLLGLFVFKTGLKSHSCSAISSSRRASSFRGVSMVAEQQRKIIGVSGRMVDGPGENFADYGNGGSLVGGIGVHG